MTDWGKHAMNVLLVVFLSTVILLTGWFGCRAIRKSECPCQPCDSCKPCKPCDGGCCPKD